PVVGDVDAFGADLGAALGDVAVADAEVVLEGFEAVAVIERVHLELRHVDEEAGADELVVHVVLAQHVTDVLAEEALDALAELLGAVHVGLGLAPSAVGLGRLGTEGGDAGLGAVVPGDVGDQVLDQGEGAHGLDRDRLGEVELVEAGHAHQPRGAIDLGRAGAALAGLAVPAHGQIGGLGGLDLVDDVEHDHAFLDFGAVLDEAATVALAAPDAEGHGRGCGAELSLGCWIGGRHLFIFLDCLLQVVGHGAHRHALQFGASVAAAVDFEVHRAPGFVLMGEIVAEVAAAALLALAAGAGDQLGHGEQAVEIEGGVPAGVVLAVAADAGAGGALAEGGDAGEGLVHLGLGADNAHPILHHLLQLVLHGEGVLAAGAALERRLGAANGGRDLVGDGGGAGGGRDLGEAGGMLAGALAEDQQIGERVAAEAVGAMQAGGAFAGGEEAGEGGHLGVAIHLDAAHEVVRGGADLHRLLGDVEIGQLLELVVHAGQLLLDVLGGVRDLLLDPGDVEEDAAVRAAAAGAHLAPDAAGDVVAGQELGRAARVLVALGVAPALLGVVGGRAAVVLGHIIEHEALALAVLEDAALAAHAFGDEDAFHTGRPDHAGGMELDELHVEHGGAGIVGERLAVAGVLPTVAGDLVGAADAAGGQHYGLGEEEVVAAALAVVAEAAEAAVAGGEQGEQRGLHVHLHALMDAVVLQGADHLEAGAVADVGQAGVAVAAKVALQNLAILGAV